MSEAKAKALYRVKGSDKPEDTFDTIQVLMVVPIEEISAAENIEEYLVQVALGAAANMLTTWEAQKDNIEPVPTVVL